MLFQGSGGGLDWGGFRDLEVMRRQLEAEASRCKRAQRDEEAIGSLWRANKIISLTGAHPQPPSSRTWAEYPASATSAPRTAHAGFPSSPSRPAHAQILKTAGAGPPSPSSASPRPGRVRTAPREPPRRPGNGEVPEGIPALRSRHSPGAPDRDPAPPAKPRAE